MLIVKDVVLSMEICRTWITARMSRGDDLDSYGGDI